MQSEASEVTLGGKTHVGPGCVCTTRHQPSWLDRGTFLPSDCFVCATILLLRYSRLHWAAFTGVGSKRNSPVSPVFSAAYAAVET